MRTRVESLGLILGGLLVTAGVGLYTHPALAMITAGGLMILASMVKKA
jgi:hypothetical protein